MINEINFVTLPPYGQVFTSADDLENKTNNNYL